MGSGGMIVLDEDDCMVDIAKYFMTFSEDESCGKCTPCREGTKRMSEILERITTGNGDPEDLERLKRLAQADAEGVAVRAGPRGRRTRCSARWSITATSTSPTWSSSAARPSKCTALIHYEIDAEKCVGCTVCAATVRWSASAARAASRT